MSVVDLNERREERHREEFRKYRDSLDARPRFEGDTVPIEEYRRVCELRRKAEKRERGLQERARKYERLLALAMRVATSDGRDADPLVSLAMLEQIDDLIENAPPQRTIEDLVQLLRDTDPALFREVATA